MEISEDKLEAAVIRMSKCQRTCLTQVVHLIAHSCWLFNKVFVAIAGDFLRETVECSSDENKSEVFVGRTDLELLECACQEEEE